MNVQINIGEFISRRAYMHPDKLSLKDAQAGRRYSYAELNSRVNRVCAALDSIGLAKGDRVALLTYNGHEFLEAFFAIAKGGLVAVPVNWRLTPREIAYILKDCGVKAIIFDSEFASAVEEIQQQGAEGSVPTLVASFGASPFNRLADHHPKLVIAKHLTKPRRKFFAVNYHFVFKTAQGVIFKYFHLFFTDY